jgi:hypothetical protein
MLNILERTNFMPLHVRFLYRLKGKSSIAPEIILAQEAISAQDTIFQSKKIRHQINVSLENYML